MPEFCSCGAQLPPDARFCHKCGKPQFEEAFSAPEPEASPAAVEVPLAPPHPAALNFHNPVAVRIGFTIASAAGLLSWLLMLGGVIWWPSAGFLSVYLYHRRTGQLLTVGGGLRMGWITGILTFVILIVLNTITLVPVALTGGLARIFQQQINSMPAGDPKVQDAIRLLQTPTGIGIVLLTSLLFIFVMVTFFCSAGGALGAKIVGKED